MQPIEKNSDLLIKQASFLELTRQNENGISEPFKFVTKRQVSIELIDTGVLVVEPTADVELDAEHNKAIIISSGIHGNETAPIEIVEGIVRDIIQEKLMVKNRVLFIIGNPVAMNISQRFKEENLNRLFNGKHQGYDTYEANRAKSLEQYVADFYSAGNEKTKLHYDLHTAIRKSMHRKFAIYPYPDQRDWNKDQLAFFLSSGINAILLGHQPSGTFSYFTSHQFKADAFTVELGRVKGFGENDMSEFVDMDTNLRKLISGEAIHTKAFDNNDFNLFQVTAELLKKDEQAFKLNIADDVRNFTEYSASYQLTEDVDGGYTVQTDGEAIVFPNPKVPVGQRAGLVVKRTML